MADHGADDESDDDAELVAVRGIPGLRRPANQATQQRQQQQQQMPKVARAPSAQPLSADPARAQALQAQRSSALDAWEQRRRELDEQRAAAWTCQWCTLDNLSLIHI